MDTERLAEQISDEDYLIRVRPFANKDGSWSGEVDISIMTLPENPLDDEDYWQVMHFAKMMCAAVPVMEEVEEIRNIVHEYVMKVLDKEMEFSVELEEEKAGVEKTYDGNVIHLHFNSRTKGNA